MVKEWNCLASLCDGLGWKYKMGLKTGDSPRKGEGWCQKENVNEEHWQMKNNYNKMKINITKTSGGSPKNVPSLGVFDFWFYIIYVIHNFNYLWLLMITDNYF